MNSQFPIRPVRVIAVFILCALQTMPGTAADPLETSFFPPEMPMRARDEIGFTEAQQGWLRQKVEEATARATQLHQRLERETEALAALAAAEQVDEAALLAQLDQVLDAERAVKRLHLSTLVAIKNQLTPAQQAKLRALRKEQAGAGGEAAAQTELRARFEGKIQRIQAGVQQWQQSGRDPAPIGRIMQEFDPLMKQGRHREAEAVLDRALAELGAGPAPKSRAGAEPAPTLPPPGTALSSAPGESQFPMIAAGPGGVHLTWTETHAGQQQVRHLRR